MSKLPTIQELDIAPKEAFAYDQFKHLLNQPPRKSWIKKHPFAKTDYIPIERVEFLLDKIFQQWRVQVLHTEQLFNSVAVTVRLHFLDPITKEWSYHDGVGAQSVQTDKGASAADMGAIKSDAIAKALPAAKSYAIRDAADHLGQLFGRDLNRKEQITYEVSRKNPEDLHKELAELYEFYGAGLTKEDQAAVELALEQKAVANYPKMINLLKTIQ